MSNVNTRDIVKLNFKVALMDAMNFNYFSDNYDQQEHVIDQVMEKRLAKMPDDEIQGFAVAVISGEEIVYNPEKDDFFIA